MKLGLPGPRTDIYLHNNMTRNDYSHKCSRAYTERIEMEQLSQKSNQMNRFAFFNKKPTNGFIIDLKRVLWQVATFPSCTIWNTLEKT